MDIENYLTALKKKGVNLWIDENGGVTCKDPDGAMTVADRDRIDTLQQEIVAWLKKGDFVSDTYPLSPAQEALWFIYKTAPKASAYNTCPISCKICFKVEPSVIEASFQALVNRHACLRTLFFTGRNGRVLQRVYAYKQAVLERIDASGADLGQLKQMAEKAYATPFDLENEIPVKLFLLSRGPRDHVLIMTEHHIIDDATTGLMFRDEFQKIYDSKAGRTADLPELDLPVLDRSYKDFIDLQQQWMDSSQGALDRAYWEKQLAGPMAPLDLPFDYPRPPVQRFQGKTRNFSIDSRLSRQITSLSKSLKKPLLRTVLAAYTVLLHRYSAQTDIVVGIPASVRPMPEFKGVAGYFINMLPIRADFSGDLDFVTLVEQISQTISQGISHMKYPFASICKGLEIEHALNISPVFQSSFSLYDKKITSLIKHPGITLNQNQAQGLVIEQQTGQFDLAVAVYQTPDAFTGAFKFNTALFKEQTIDQMISHFKVLLEAMVKNPEHPLSKMPILTDEEHDKVLMGFNTTQGDCPPDKCIHELFEDRVKKTPGAIALIFEDQQWTYDELNQRANQLGHHLKGLGIGPDRRVAICMERSVEMIVGLLGILKAGGAYVPVDPEYPAQRIAFMLEDAKVFAVLTQSRFLSLLPEIQATLVCPDREWEVIGREGKENLGRCAAWDDLAYVIYTSGSTGTPKGICIPHGALPPLVTHTDYICITPEDRIAHASNVSFDAATFEIWGALANGAALVGINRETALSPSRLTACVRERGISILFMTTALLNQIARLNPGAFSSLRYLLFGGEAVNPQRVKQILDTAPPENILHMYGPSETTTYATWHRITHVPERANTIPIGRPLASKVCYILDKNGLPVPIGVKGELHIGGAGLARGYLNRPELTQKAFIPNPFTPGSRIYKTGDLCRYLPDGAIEFVGRGDFQVKIRGFRIELGEIQRILEGHAKIKDAFIMVHETRSGDKQILAYLVVENSSHTPDDARRFLEKRLPDYMIPAGFIMLDALPLTPNGKVDRGALPLPDAGLMRTHDIVCPANETEKIISRIWKEMLTLDTISVHDNFFRMGGHSLLAVAVVARMEAVFRARISIRKLFELPTIRELGREMDRRASGGEGEAFCPILPVASHTPCPLSLTQQRLWYLSDMDGGKNFTYNVPLSCRITGDVDIEGVKWALNEIIARHKALRTVIAHAKPPVQVRFPELTLGLPVTDLRNEKDPDKTALCLASQEVETPFDLTCGPFIRAKILCLEDQKFLLLITIHHLIFDGWSSGIFFQEFQKLYCAFAQDTPPDLPDLDIQYPDFAHWQENEFSGDRLKTHIDFWKGYLEGAPSLFAPPTDFPRGPVQTFNGDSLGFELDEDLAQKIKALGQKAGTTLFMTLHAAFATLMLGYTGKEDMVLGTLIANRNHRQIEQLIGFFGNLLPLRTDLSGDPSFTTLLDRVKQSVVGAFAHQDLPFEMLLNGLGIKRDRRQPPLFQVVFDSPNIGPFGECFGVADATFEILDLGSSNVTKYDLDVSVEERGGKIRGVFVYNTDLFCQGTIASMKDGFVALLAAIAAAPDKKLSQLYLRILP